MLPPPAKCRRPESAFVGIVQPGSGKDRCSARPSARAVLADKLRPRFRISGNVGPCRMSLKAAGISRTQAHYAWYNPEENGMWNVRIASAACLVLLASLLTTTSMAADRMRIGVTEFVYSDLAQQIGGPAITIDLVQRRTAAAQGGTASITAYDLILCDGAAEDAWLRDAVQHASPQPVVLEIPHQPSADEGAAAFPWYDLKAMSGLAQDFAKQISSRNPAQAQEIATNLVRYLRAFQPVDSRIAEIAKDYEGSEVFVTDDLFRGILKQMRFKVQDEAYVKSLQSGAAPSAKSLAALKQAITLREASILLYDRDATNPATKALVAAANDAGVPVVGLRERLPTALHYQQWMLRQLNAVHGALNEAAP